MTKSFDGTEIYWELHGPTPESCNKTPLVFCYGLSCSMNQWRAQLERYSKHRPCLLLDYRGHHMSSFPKDEKLMNMSALAKDVAASMKAAGCQGPAHIWGHSMGVLVALELALAHPELCKSLVLICGTLHDPFTTLIKKEISEKLVHPILKTYGNRAEYFVLMWKLILLQPKLTESIARLVGFNARASTPEDTRAYSLALANINPRAFFPLFIEMTQSIGDKIVRKVKTPSAVIAGGRDLVTPPSEQRYLAEHLAHSAYIEIPTGSHNVQLDFGEYVSLKVEDFWKSLGFHD